MAATVALQLRPKYRTIGNPNFIHFFSSSTSEPNVEDQNNTSSSPSESQSQSQSQSQPQPQPQPSFSSYFSDVRASLKQSPQQQKQPRKPFSPSSSTPNPSNVASLEEIRKNLAEFRRRAAVPPSDGKSSPPQSQHISFQELYKRNVMPSGQNAAEANKGGNLSLDAIRESLRQLRPNSANSQGNGGVKPKDSMSLSNFKEVLKIKPEDPKAKKPTMVIGGTGELPKSVFGREMNVRKEEESTATRTEFVKLYSYDELGKKLRLLRPEAKEGNWFSLGELNERLMKLREIEEKEAESHIGGVKFRDLRESLQKLYNLDEEKKKKSSLQKLNVLGQLAGPPTFMLSPPKEQLVEKYFHPDNMSSSDKLKLELQKVRDEFKMSESDCGSARVQVAQLTTKIKHLSTALHKKDKHSRKGLQGMVQRRKKLLKYLRRTDWDSYCLVLSKLGLRDNPDYKN